MPRLIRFGREILPLPLSISVVMIEVVHTIVALLPLLSLLLFAPFKQNKSILAA